MEFITVVLYEQGEQREILVPANADLTRLWLYADEIRIKEKE
jgi:hypothetical protein